MRSCTPHLDNTNGGFTYSPGSRFSSQIVLGISRPARFKNNEMPSVGSLAPLFVVSEPDCLIDGRERPETKVDPPDSISGAIYLL